MGSYAIIVLRQSLGAELGNNVLQRQLDFMARTYVAAFDLLTIPWSDQMWLDRRVVYPHSIAGSIS